MSLRSLASYMIICNKHPSCVEKVRISKIVLKENHRSFVLRNPNRREVVKVRVDGCLIRGSPACDWALIVPEEPREWYVELKGSNVNHAITQLEETILRISTDPRRSRKRSYIVSSNCPLISTKLQQAILRFRKDFNSEFRIRSRQHCEDLA
jgi:hypothetical protein